MPYDNWLQSLPKGHWVLWDVSRPQDLEGGYLWTCARVTAGTVSEGIGLSRLWVSALGASLQAKLSRDLLAWFYPKGKPTGKE